MNAHDAVMFLFLGLVTPALYLAATGTPLPLTLWVVAFLLYTIFKPGSKSA